MRPRHAMLAAIAAAAAVALLAPAAYATTSRPDVTSPLEARRVDRVPVSGIDWQPCYDTAVCASVPLPLDYDRPRGAQVQVAVIRIPARDPEHRIGSLFLNPGGPGGSGVDIAREGQLFLGPEVLDRFDLVGVDPRGTNGSTQVRCFGSPAEQAAALGGLTDVPFPFTAEEDAAGVASARAFGRGCSTTGKPLAASMSTAEVARDFDVIRRAVGDEKLTYLGFSYGSYLGQVYANLFPDRFRALVVDGVVDPVAWAGTERTADVSFSDRLRSGEASTRAFFEILDRCDAAGPDVCRFASDDSRAAFAALADSLKAHPVVLTDPADPTGGTTITLTYSLLVAELLDGLYVPGFAELLTDVLADVAVLTGTSTAVPAPAASPELLATAGVDWAALRAAGTSAAPSDYDNWLEGSEGVSCTDTRNPSNAAAWPRFAAAAERRAPYFGRFWSWWSAPCATQTWTARDEDAYRGPFTRRTSAPVLVVGNLWDPATRYEGAVAAARLLPNSRLISSDSWGHTAYGTSACVTDAVDRYLVTGEAPAATLNCRGDLQPFEPAPLRAAERSAAPQRSRPPVVPLGPGAHPALMP